MYNDGVDNILMKVENDTKQFVIIRVLKLHNTFHLSYYFILRFIMEQF